MEKPAWWYREMNRFVDRTYTCPPWKGCNKCTTSMPGVQFDPLPEIEMHVLHMCIHDPKLLAYTENDDKGKRDIQTRIKPGKYLRTYYPHLKPEEVAFYASLVGLTNRDQDLLFARTAEEIETVYRTGPPSCMTYETSAFGSRPIHPVRAYSGPDLSVAYIHGKTNGNGKCSVAARTLTWPEKKIYSRVYGDGGAYTSKLIAALNERGFTEGAMYGARLSIIRHGTLKRHEFIVPYVDGCSALREENGFLVLCENGDIRASSTSGIATLPTRRCDHCAEAYVVSTGTAGIRRQLCAACTETQIVVCERRGEEVLRSDTRAVNTKDGTARMCVRCVGSDFTECDTCHIMFENGVCIQDSEVNMVCPTCRNNTELYAGYCIRCAAPVHKDNRDKRRTQTMCKGCSKTITWENKAKEQNINLDPELLKKAMEWGFNPIEYQASLKEVLTAVRAFIH